jgi:hypothetical protein
MRLLLTAMSLVLVLLSVTVHAEPFERKAWELDAPVLAPWRIIEPDQAYHGQWLVAGDLNGDGLAEIVTARQDNQRVTTVLATRLDGKTLWRWGKPNTGVPQLNSDVPVQIYDLDGDGRPEVYLSIEGGLLVLDGRTGKESRRLKLPDGLKVADCITFANLRGGPRARDIIIKDRYTQLWAYTDDWKLLWHWRPARYKTCHHPTLIDIDGDGRDEVMAGYTMLDDNGRELWTIEVDKIDQSRGHLDCCEVLAAGKRPEDFRLVVSFCGANAMAIVDGEGALKRVLMGEHYESIDVGKVRADLPGKQIVVDVAHQTFRKGALSLFDSEGSILGSYLCGDSRHHRLIDWDGDGTEEILAAQEQRLLDGNGQCVFRLGPTDAFKRATPVPPDQDHEPFGLIGDLDGDERPEIILYSMKRILIYRSENAARVPSLKLGTGVNVTLY